MVLSVDTMNAHNDNDEPTFSTLGLQAALIINRLRQLKQMQDSLDAAPSRVKNEPTNNADDSGAGRQDECSDQGNREQREAVSDNATAA